MYRKTCALLTILCCLAANLRANVIADFGSDAGKINAVGSFTFPNDGTGSTSTAVTLVNADSWQLDSNPAAVDGHFLAGMGATLSSAVDLSGTDTQLYLAVSVKGLAGNTIAGLKVDLASGGYSNRSSYQFDLSSLSTADFETRVAATPLSMPAQTFGTGFDFSSLTNLQIQAVGTDGEEIHVEIQNLQILDPAELVVHRLGTNGEAGSSGYAWGGDAGTRSFTSNADSWVLQGNDGAGVNGDIRGPTLTEEIDYSPYSQSRYLAIKARSVAGHADNSIQIRISANVFDIPGAAQNVYNFDLTGITDTGYAVFAATEPLNAPAEMLNGGLDMSSSIAAVSATGFSGFVFIDSDAGGDADGFHLEVSEVLLVNSASGFDSWAGSAGLSGNDALALTDADGDGLSNLLEYGLSETTDPSVKDRDQVMLPTVSPDSGRLKITFPRVTGRTDINYYAEATNDLASGSWTVLASSTAGATVTVVEAGAVVNVAAAGSTETVEVTDSVTFSGNRFLRLRIEQP